MESEQSSPTAQELTPVTPAAERTRRQRRKGAAIMTALRLNQQPNTRPLGVERQSKGAMLMTLARRAVRHAMEEPRSFSGRLQQDRLLRRWKRYTSALANRSGWRF